jgi:hypothetical protein
MSELNYIGADELVFNNDIDNGIHSGGFSVNSIMMKAGMSPIMTLNNNDSIIGGGNKVSDLFNDLVVPNWALTYNNRIIGGKYKEVDHNDDSESDDEVISDDLHDKLLHLVREHNVKSKENKKKITRKNKKILSKKRGTKKKK